MRMIPPSNNQCYAGRVAIKRFSVSTDEETHAAIKAHAEAQGLDVSSYLMAAARQLMAMDDLVASRFADVDAAIARAEAAEEEPEVEVTPEDAEAMDGFIDSLLAPPPGQSAA